MPSSFWAEATWIAATKKGNIKTYGVDNHPHSRVHFTVHSALGVGEVLSVLCSLRLAIPRQSGWTGRTSPERCRVGRNAPASLGKELAYIYPCSRAHDHCGRLDSNYRNVGRVSRSPDSDTSYRSKFDRHGVVLVHHNSSMRREVEDRGLRSWRSRLSPPKKIPSRTNDPSREN